jgi:hypothetical protein
MLRSLICGSACVAVCAFALDAQQRPQAPPRIGSRTAAAETRFKDLATQLAAQPADDCSPLTAGPPPTAIHEAENNMFAAVDQGVVAAVDGPESVGRAASVADFVLRQFQDLSAQANSSWPDDRRFHYQVLDLGTAIALEFTIRSRATFSVLGVPELFGGSDQRRNNNYWEQVGNDAFRTGAHRSEEKLDLTRLEPSPSRRARFFAQFSQVGCGGTPTEVDYRGYQWNPADTGNLKTVLHQSGVIAGAGAFDELASPNAQPQHVTASVDGTVQITAKTVVLPYCRPSAVETHGGPVLCDVDTYDVSGEDIRFVSRTTNRPDLDAIAKLIEYAQGRDVLAASAYTADPKVAHDAMQQIPTDIAIESIRVMHASPTKETVHMQDGLDLTFDLAKIRGRWLVTAFTIGD